MCVAKACVFPAGITDACHKTRAKPHQRAFVQRCLQLLRKFCSDRLDKKVAHCGRTERVITDYGRLKDLFSISWLVAAGVWSAIVSTNAQVNVTHYHNHISRDGLYIDSAF